MYSAVSLIGTLIAESDSGKKVFNHHKGEPMTNETKIEQQLENLTRARYAAVPIVVLKTPDQWAAQRRIMAHEPLLNYHSSGEGKTAFVSWDACRDVQPLNKAGIPIAEKFGQTGEYPDGVCSRLPQLDDVTDTVVFIHNAHRWLNRDGGDTRFIQSLSNARESCKAAANMIVLMGPEIMAPIEIKNDVLIVDDHLPDRAELRELTERLADNVGLALTDEQVDTAVAACRGCSAFAAEQLVQMNLSKKAGGLRRDEIWAAKERLVRETRGLSVVNDKTPLDDLCGVDAIVKFSKLLSTGRNINGVIFIDEIEKDLGGAAGDSSGVSQDQLKVMLETMQDENQAGVLLVGGGGTGKTQVAKSIANFKGVPCLKIDAGAAKGPHVGESQAYIRDLMKVALTVTDGNALWVATSNKLESIPPELKRRFRYGTWFFDLPNAEAREALWRVKTAKAYKVGYELKKVSESNAQQRPDDQGWTGAEIESCCELSATLDVPLSEAAAYIVPIFKAEAGQLDELRQSANNRWLDASKGGLYQADRVELSIQPKNEKRSAKLAD